MQTQRTREELFSAGYMKAADFAATLQVNYMMFCKKMAEGVIPFELPVRGGHNGQAPRLLSPETMAKIKEVHAMYAGAYYNYLPFKQSPVGPRQHEPRVEPLADRLARINAEHKAERSGVPALKRALEEMSNDSGHNPSALGPPKPATAAVMEILNHPTAAPAPGLATMGITGNTYQRVMAKAKALHAQGRFEAAAEFYAFAAELNSQ